MHQDFGVGGSLEVTPFLLELGAKFPEVVDLAVADDPRAAFRARKWLVSALRVDDRQATHADAAVPVDVHAAVVRATMRDRPFHACENGGFHARLVEPEHA